MSERLRGIPSSDGFAVGQVQLQDEPRRVEVRYQVPANRLAAEMDRLENAFNAVDRQLTELKRKLRVLPNKDPFTILEAHQGLLNDSSFREAALSRVQRQRINAEWALEQTIREIRSVFESIEDTYIRSRMEDILSLRDQILQTLRDPLGEEDNRTSSLVGVILAARDFGPDTAIRAIRSGAAAILAEESSPNTHAAIIARAMGIPMICGIPGLTRKLPSGAQIIVDGQAGEIIIGPDVATIGLYKKRQIESAVLSRELWRQAIAPGVLADRTPVLIQANVDIADEIADGRIEIVDGIGLFRTEIPFLFAEEPSEDDLVEQYRMIMDIADAKPVVFRLFDLGADKLSWYRKSHQRHEANPSLGLRGIRFLLQDERLLRRQVRAIIRVVPTPIEIRILVPMVTRLSDMTRTRGVILQEADQLMASPDRIKLGAMVETPAAALQLKALLGECSFFSIGTNDLIQYILAVDRSNEAVAEAFDAAHPAVLRILDMVVQDAGKTPLTLCGEVGGNAFFIPLLLGLGLRSFSMPVRSVPKAKAMLSGLTIKECRSLAQRCLVADSGVEIRALLSVFHRSRTGIVDQGT